MCEGARAGPTPMLQSGQMHEGLLTWFVFTAAGRNALSRQRKKGGGGGMVLGVKSVSPGCCAARR